VLAFEHRVRKLTGDGELAKARASFDAAYPMVNRLRDYIAHLDDYAVGDGRLQTVSPAVLDDKYPSPLLGWVQYGSTFLTIGDAQVMVEDAARRAIELAEVVERVRERHLERVEREANAELRRRAKEHGAELPE
jgi:hypothetical protein